MSRAFVKEDEDGAAEPLPPRRISDHPNYVTPEGLARLEHDLGRVTERRAQLQALPDDPAAVDELRHAERDLAYLEARLGSAMLVDLSRQPRDQVAFGASVTVRAAGGGPPLTYTIVGEDEADAEAGLVSHVSPLARALLGSRVGDIVTWKRPAGDLILTVEAISYAA